MWGRLFLGVLLVVALVAGYPYAGQLFLTLSSKYYP